MSSLSFRVDGPPVPWQRTRVATSAFGRVRLVNAAALTEYQHRVATAAAIAMKAQGWKMIEAGPVAVTLTFYLPIPASLSKRKQEALAGRLHDVRPDIDNLEKAVIEVFSKPDRERPRAGLVNDDSQIAAVTKRKLWSRPADAGVDVEVMTHGRGEAL